MKSVVVTAYFVVSVAIVTTHAATVSGSPGISVVQSSTNTESIFPLEPSYESPPASRAFDLPTARSRRTPLLSAASLRSETVMTNSKNPPNSPLLMPQKTITGSLIMSNSSEVEKQVYPDTVTKVLQRPGNEILREFDSELMSRYQSSVHEGAPTSAEFFINTAQSDLSNQPESVFDLTSSLSVIEPTSVLYSREHMASVNSEHMEHAVLTSQTVYNNISPTKVIKDEQALQSTGRTYNTLHQNQSKITRNLHASKNMRHSHTTANTMNVFTSSSSVETHHLDQDDLISSVTGTEGWSPNKDIETKLMTVHKTQNRKEKYRATLLDNMASHTNDVFSSSEPDNSVYYEMQSSSANLKTHHMSSQPLSNIIYTSHDQVLLSQESFGSIPESTMATLEPSIVDRLSQTNLPSDAFLAESSLQELVLHSSSISVYNPFDQEPVTHGQMSSLKQRNLPDQQVWFSDEVVYTSSNEAQIIQTQVLLNKNHATSFDIKPTPSIELALKSTLNQQINSAETDLPEEFSMGDKHSNIAASIFKETSPTIGRSHESAYLQGALLNTETSLPLSTNDIAMLSSSVVLEQDSVSTAHHYKHQSSESMLHLDDSASVVLTSTLSRISIDPTYVSDVLFVSPFLKEESFDIVKQTNLQVKSSHFIQDAPISVFPQSSATRESMATFSIDTLDSQNTKMILTDVKVPVATDHTQMSGIQIPSGIISTSKVTVSPMSSETTYSSAFISSLENVDIASSDKQSNSENVLSDFKLHTANTATQLGFLIFPPSVTKLVSGFSDIRDWETNSVFERKPIREENLENMGEHQGLGILSTIEPSFSTNGKFQTTSLPSEAIGNSGQFIKSTPPLDMSKIFPTSQPHGMTSLRGSVLKLFSIPGSSPVATRSHAALYSSSSGSSFVNLGSSNLFSISDISSESVKDNYRETSLDAQVFVSSSLFEPASALQKHGTETPRTELAESIKADTHLPNMKSDIPAPFSHFFTLTPSSAITQDEDVTIQSAGLDLSKYSSVFPGISSPEYYPNSAFRLILTDYGPLSSYETMNTDKGSNQEATKVLMSSVGMLEGREMLMSLNQERESSNLLIASEGTIVPTETLNMPYQGDILNSFSLDYFAKSGALALRTGIVSDPNPSSIYHTGNPDITKIHNSLNAGESVHFGSTIITFTQDFATSYNTIKSPGFYEESSVQLLESSELDSGVISTQFLSSQPYSLAGDTQHAKFITDTLSASSGVFVAPTPTLPDPDVATGTTTFSPQLELMVKNVTSSYEEETVTPLLLENPATQKVVSDEQHVEASTKTDVLDIRPSPSILPNALATSIADTDVVSSMVTGSSSSKDARYAETAQVWSTDSFSNTLLYTGVHTQVTTTAQHDQMSDIINTTPITPTTTHSDVTPSTLHSTETPAADRQDSLTLLNIQPTPTLPGNTHSTPTANLISSVNTPSSGDVTAHSTDDVFNAIVSPFDLAQINNPSSIVIAGQQLTSDYVSVNEDLINTNSVFTTPSSTSIYEAQSVQFTLLPSLKFDSNSASSVDNSVIGTPATVNTNASPSVLFTHLSSAEYNETGASTSQPLLASTGLPVAAVSTMATQVVAQTVSMSTVNFDGRVPSNKSTQAVTSVIPATAESESLMSQETTSKGTSVAIVSTQLPDAGSTPAAKSVTAANTLTAAYTAADTVTTDNTVAYTPTDASPAANTVTAGNSDTVKSEPAVSAPATITAKIITNITDDDNMVTALNYNVTQSKLVNSSAPIATTTLPAEESTMHATLSSQNGNTTESTLRTKRSLELPTSTQDPINITSLLTSQSPADSNKTLVSGLSKVETTTDQTTYNFTENQSAQSSDLGPTAGQVTPPGGRDDNMTMTENTTQTLVSVTQTPMPPGNMTQAPAPADNRTQAQMSGSNTAHISSSNTTQALKSADSTIQVPLSTSNTTQASISAHSTTQAPVSADSTIQVPITDRNTTQVPKSTSNTTQALESANSTTPVPLPTDSVTQGPVSVGNTTRATVSATNATQAPVSISNTTQTPMSINNTTQAPMFADNTTQAPMFADNTTQAPMSVDNTTPVPISATSTSQASMSVNNTTQAPVSIDNATQAQLPTDYNTMPTTQEPTPSKNFNVQFSSTLQDNTIKPTKEAITNVTTSFSNNTVTPTNLTVVDSNTTTTTYTIMTTTDSSSTSAIEDQMTDTTSLHSNTTLTVTPLTNLTTEMPVTNMNTEHSNLNITTQSPMINLTTAVSNITATENPVAILTTGSTITNHTATDVNTPSTTETPMNNLTTQSPLTNMTTLSPVSTIVHSNMTTKEIPVTNLTTESNTTSTIETPMANMTTGGSNIITATENILTNLTTEPPVINQTTLEPNTTTTTPMTNLTTTDFITTTSSEAALTNMTTVTAQPNLTTTDSKTTSPPGPLANTTREYPITNLTTVVSNISTTTVPPVTNLTTITPVVNLTTADYNTTKTTENPMTNLTTKTSVTDLTTDSPVTNSAATNFNITTATLAPMTNVTTEYPLINLTSADSNATTTTITTITNITTVGTNIITTTERPVTNMTTIDTNTTTGVPTTNVTTEPAVTDLTTIHFSMTDLTTESPLTNLTTLDLNTTTTTLTPMTNLTTESHVINSTTLKSNSTTTTPDTNLTTTDFSTTSPTDASVTNMTTVSPMTNLTTTNSYTTSTTEAAVMNMTAVTPITKLTNTTTKTPVTNLTTESSVTNLTTEDLNATTTTLTPMTNLTAETPITNLTTLEPNTTTTATPATNLTTTDFNNTSVPEAPMTNLTTVTPVTNLTTVNFNTTTTTENLVTYLTTSDSNTSITTEMPMTNMTTVDSNTTATTEAPATNLSTTEYNTTMTTEPPMINLTTEFPVNNLTTPDSNTTSATEEPVTNVTTESSVSNLITESPVTILTTVDLNTTATTLPPMTNLTTESPMVNLTTTDFNTTSTPETPVTNMTTISPVNNLTTTVNPITNLTTVDLNTTTATETPVNNLTTSDSNTSITTEVPVTNVTTVDSNTTAKTEAPATNLTSTEYNTTMTTETPMTNITTDSPVNTTSATEVPVINVTTESSMNNLTTESPVTNLTTTDFNTTSTPETPVTNMTTVNPITNLTTVDLNTTTATETPVNNLTTSDSNTTITTEVPVTNVTTVDSNTTAMTEAPATNLTSTEYNTTMTTETPMTNFTTDSPVNTTSATEVPVMNATTESSMNNLTTESPVTNLTTTDFNTTSTPDTPVTNMTTVNPITNLTTVDLNTTTATETPVNNLTTSDSNTTITTEVPVTNVTTVDSSTTAMTEAPATNLTSTEYNTTMTTETPMTNFTTDSPVNTTSATEVPVMNVTTESSMNNLTTESPVTNLTTTDFNTTSTPDTPVTNMTTVNPITNLTTVDLNTTTATETPVTNLTTSDSNTTITTEVPVTNVTTVDSNTTAKTEAPATNLTTTEYNTTMTTETPVTNVTTESPGNTTSATEVPVMNATTESSMNNLTTESPVTNLTTTDFNTTSTPDTPVTNMTTVNPITNLTTVDLNTTTATATPATNLTTTDFNTTLTTDASVTNITAVTPVTNLTTADSNTTSTPEAPMTNRTTISPVNNLTTTDSNTTTTTVIPEINLTTSDSNTTIPTERPITNMTTVDSNTTTTTETPVSNLTTSDSITTTSPLRNFTTTDSDITTATVTPISNMTTIGSNISTTTERRPLTNMTTADTNTTVEVPLTNLTTEAPPTNLTTMIYNITTTTEALVNNLTTTVEPTPTVSVNISTVISPINVTTPSTSLIPNTTQATNPTLETTPQPNTTQATNTTLETTLQPNTTQATNATLETTTPSVTTQATDTTLETTPQPVTTQATNTTLETTPQPNTTQATNTTLETTPPSVTTQATNATLETTPPSVTIQATNTTLETTLPSVTTQATTTTLEATPQPNTTQATNTTLESTPQPNTTQATNTTLESTPQPNTTQATNTTLETTSQTNTTQTTNTTLETTPQPTLFMSTAISTIKPTTPSEGISSTPNITTEEQTITPSSPSTMNDTITTSPVTTVTTPFTTVTTVFPRPTGSVTTDQIDTNTTTVPESTTPTSTIQPTTITSVPDVTTADTTTSSLLSTTAKLPTTIAQTTLGVTTEPLTTTSTTVTTNATMVTEATTIEPTTEWVLNISDSYSDYWIRTVIKVPLNQNVTLLQFRSRMEWSFARLYERGYQRQGSQQQENADGGSTGQRQKRAVKVDNTTVQMTNITRWNTFGGNPSDVTNTELVYYVLRHDNLTEPAEAVAALNTVSDQEMALELGYVVVVRAEPFIPPTVPPPVENRAWIAGAVIGSIAGAVLLVWLVLFIYFKCTRAPQSYQTGKTTPRSQQSPRQGAQLVKYDKREFKGFDVARTELNMEEGRNGRLPSDRQGRALPEKNGLSKQGTDRQLPRRDHMEYEQEQAPPRKPPRAREPMREQGAGSELFERQEDQQLMASRNGKSKGTGKGKGRSRSRSHGPKRDSSTKRQKMGTVGPAEEDDDFNRPDDTTAPPAGPVKIRTTTHAIKLPPVVQTPLVAGQPQEPLSRDQELRQSLQQKADIERWRNKQRARKRSMRKQRSGESEESKSSYQQFQDEVENILGEPPSQQEMPDVFVQQPRKKKKKRPHKRTGHQEVANRPEESLEMGDMFGPTTDSANFSPIQPQRVATQRAVPQNESDTVTATDTVTTDTEEEESLQDARQRMHALLDDAFSLIRPPSKRRKNRIRPSSKGPSSKQTSVDNGERPTGYQSDGEGSTEVHGSTQRETAHHGPKHTPMFVSSGKASTHNGLPAENPYSVSDEAARIIPTQASERVLAGAVETPIRSVKQAFEEPRATSQSSRGQHPTSAVQAFQMSSQGSTESDTLPLKMQETNLGGTPTAPITSKKDLLPTDYTSLSMSSSMFNKPPKGTSAREKHRNKRNLNSSGYSGKVNGVHQEKDVIEETAVLPLHLTSVDADLDLIHNNGLNASDGKVLEKQNGAVKPKHERVPRASGSDDELDIVSKVMKPGASAEPLVSSIKNELLRLSQRAAEQMPGATFS